MNDKARRQQSRMRIISLALCLTLLNCSPAGVQIYAPPEFAEGKIIINGKVAGTLGRNQRGYRWPGFRKLSDEFGKPPRSECRGTVQLVLGEYTVEVSQEGYEPLRRRFRYDGDSPKQIDLSGSFVTPTLIWARQPQTVNVSPIFKQRFADALQRISKGDYAGAADTFDALSRSQKDPAVMLNLALSAWSGGDRRRAAIVIGEIRAEYDGYWLAMYDEAVLLLKEGRIERASELADELRRVQPSNPAYVRLASALISRTGG